MNEIIILGSSLTIGLLFNYFFFEKVPGISFPIFIGAVILGIFLLKKFYAEKASRDFFWLLVPLSFFSLMVFIRASLFLTFLNILATLILLLVLASVFWKGKLRSFFIEDLIKVIFLPFKFIAPLFKTIGNLFAGREDAGDKKIFSHVVKGLLLAAPFLAIFIFLFSSADLVFQRYVENLIAFDVSEEFITRTILIIAVALGFTGAYSYLALSVTRDFIGRRFASEVRLGKIESGIILSLVNILFLFFIALQVAYLFGGEEIIRTQGFTYADYARRGFFELIAVSAISLIMILGLDKFAVRADERHPLLFKILSYILIVQVGAIMFSAHTRLALYENAYGFTVDRFFSHAFIIFLAIIFLIVLYKSYGDKKENEFVWPAFISAVIFLALLNVFNPDAFIAKKNIERYNSTGKLDVPYLGELSEDALFVVIKGLEIQDQNLKNELARELYLKQKRLSKNSLFNQWQSLNISRINAKKLLDERNLQEPSS